MAFQSPDTYKYCPQCGGTLERRIIKSREPERLVCSQCDYVLYVDPKVAVIAVVPKDGGVVMTRRRVNPGYGLWVLPGGFMDVGELLEDAVIREVEEEANIRCGWTGSWGFTLTRIATSW